MIRRPPTSTQSRSSAASDVYKRQGQTPLFCQLFRGASRLRVVLRAPMGAQVFPYLPPHLLISPAAHERVSCFLTQLDPWLIKRVDVVELPGNSGRHFKYIYELTHMVGVHFGQSECHRGTTPAGKSPSGPHQLRI